MIQTPSFIEVRPNSWDEVKKLGEKLVKTCVFRGMERNEWGLETSIERTTVLFGVPPEERWYREKEILRIFKSRAHHYIQSPPNENDNLEWLAQIQHYGGPTRLLDFTESFYIACFFAIEKAQSDACVWAVNRALLNEKIRHLGLSKLETEGKVSLLPRDLVSPVEEFIKDSTKKQSLIFPIIPPRLNERLAVQRGLFLFPCDIEKSFVNNLCRSLDLSFDTLGSENAKQWTEIDINGLYADSVSIWKINLSRNFQNDAIQDLFSMNIDAASLFPGLDGFARSLNYNLRYIDFAKRKISSLTVYPINPNKASNNQ
jgi:hypothetical protein